MQGGTAGEGDLRSRLRSLSWVVVLAVGLVLLALSILIGSNVSPPVSAAAASAGRFLAPSLTVGSSTALITILLFGVSLALLVFVATTATALIPSVVARLAKLVASDGTRPRRRILSPALVLPVALVLYALSILVGSTTLSPPVRAAAAAAGRFLAPSLTVDASAALISVLLVGVSLGLLLSITMTGARFILSAVARVANLETVGEPVMPGGVRIPRFMLSGQMGRLVDTMSREVSDQMVSAGVIGSPVLYVSRFIVYAVASEIIVLPLSIFLAYFFGQPLLLLLVLVPAVSLVVPRMLVSSKLGESVRGVDEELPQFAIFAAILQSAGVSLYNAFDRIAGSSLFKWMEYEGLLIKRETLFFGMTQTAAIDQRAREQRSEKFRSYLQGYSSVLTSGGDITGYLEGRAKEFLNWTEFKWKTYAQESGNVGEAIISIFFTLPLLILAAAFISPGTTILIVAATIIVIVPLLGALGYTTVARMQPKTYDQVKGRWIFASAAGVIAAVVCSALNQEAWVILAAGVGVFSAIFGYSTVPQLRSISRTEDALPAFVRDVTEYKKIGYDVTKAIQKLAHERSYNHQLDVLLKDVSVQLDMRNTLKDVVVRTRSWLTRMVFFMLGQIVETGGGTPELLESVNDYTQRMVTVKKETRANMRLYEILAFATPVGLALMISLLYVLVQYFGGGFAAAQVASPFAGISALPPSFLDMTRVLVVEVAVVLAFLASRTVEFTNQNTTRITACVAVAVAAILLSELLTPLLHSVGL